MDGQNTEMRILLVGAAYKVAIHRLTTENGIRRRESLPCYAAVVGVQNIVPLVIGRFRVAVHKNETNFLRYKSHNIRPPVVVAHGGSRERLPSPSPIARRKQSDLSILFVLQHDPAVILIHERDLPNLRPFDGE